jgi:hypothetical protein
MKKLHINITVRGETVWGGEVKDAENKPVITFQVRHTGGKTFFYPQNERGSGLSKEEDQALRAHLSSMADEYFKRDFVWI